MTNPHIREHARLSPSGADRWIRCTPSVALGENFPDTSSVYADEGTAAHELAELKILRDIPATRKTDISTVGYSKEIERFRKENKYYTADMDRYTDDYLFYVKEQYYTALSEDAHAFIGLESTFSLDAVVPGSYGHIDVVIVTQVKITVIDLKYGAGIPVSALLNPQLRLYALGALIELGFMGEIERVAMHIFQPRINNFSVFSETPETLWTWARTVVAPAATKAHYGVGEYNPGSHCKFCKAKASCSARADAMLSVDRVPKGLLTNREISKLLPLLSDISAWAKDVSAHALSVAVAGGKIPGYKIVEGRSNRTFTDTQKVIGALWEKMHLSYAHAIPVLLLAGFKPEDPFIKDVEKAIRQYLPVHESPFSGVPPLLFDVSLLPLSTLEKEMGKKLFNAALGPLIHKPMGAPTLVEESDPRRPYDATTSAIKDFDGIEIPG